jgi:hypothetical protein
LVAGNWLLAGCSAAVSWSMAGAGPEVGWDCVCAAVALLLEPVDDEPHPAATRAIAAARTLGTT